MYNLYIALPIYGCYTRLWMLHSLHISHVFGLRTFLQPLCYPAFFEPLRYSIQQYNAAYKMLLHCTVVGTVFCYICHRLTLFRHMEVFSDEQ